MITVAGVTCAPLPTVIVATERDPATGLAKVATVTDAPAYPAILKTLPTAYPVPLLLIDAVVIDPLITSISTVALDPLPPESATPV